MVGRWPAVRFCTGGSDSKELLLFNCRIKMAVQYLLECMCFAPLHCGLQEEVYFHQLVTEA